MRNRKDICVRKSNKIKKLPKLLLCRGGNFCLFKFATNVRSIKPNLKITKKAQEEVVGFVAIVVIVAILLVLVRVIKGENPFRNLPIQIKKVKTYTNF